MLPQKNPLVYFDIAVGPDAAPLGRVVMEVKKDVSGCVVHVPVIRGHARMRAGCVEHTTHVTVLM